jgi:stearoyl-CoA desaturase (delta-9 desaturase)
MLVIDLVLFGPVGLTIWAVQMIWIPFFAAGVINGVAHWRGYRNFETPDAATNISPWGILIGGEELHNNHHAFASSARFSSRAWEFDIGWWYIRMFAALRLATVKKVALAPIIDGRKQRIDVDTLSAVITHQFHVMADYARDVVKKVHREEVQNAAKEIRSLLRPTKRLLTREERLMSEQQRWTLKRGLSHSRTLTVVYEYRRKLQEIFADRHASAETLIGRLQEWCGAAEQTGIAALSDFAETLHGYTLKSAAV